MKKFLFALSLVIILGSTVVYAKPWVSYVSTLLPVDGDNTNDIGTSTSAFRDLFIKGNFTNSSISDGCASWASGILTSTGVSCGTGSGGGSGIGWTWNSINSLRTTSTTDDVLIGRTSTTTTSKLEVDGQVTAQSFTSTSTTEVNTFANEVHITNGGLQLPENSDVVFNSGGASEVGFGQQGTSQLFFSGSAGVSWIWDMSELSGSNKIGTMPNWSGNVVVATGTAMVPSITSTSTDTSTFQGPISAPSFEGSNTASPGLLELYDGANLKIALDSTTGTSSYITSGNFGVGTTSPYERLSVAGNVVASRYISTSTTGASTFPYASTTALSSNYIQVNNTGENAIKIWNPADALYSLTFGLTNSETSGLIQSPYGLNFKTTANAGAPYDGSMSFTTVAGGGDFKFLNGNVGIATSTPGANLDVYGGARFQGTQGNNQLTIAATGNNNRPVLYMGTAGDIDEFRLLNNGMWQVGTTAAIDLDLITSAISRLRINGSTGNVGLGTTSPFAKLSVAGGDIHVGGIVTSTSTTAASTFPYASTTQITTTKLYAPLSSSIILSATSSMGTGTTTRRFTGLSQDWELTEIGCSSAGSGTFKAQLGDGTSSTTIVTSEADNAQSFTAISANNAFSRGEAFYIDFGTVSGAVSQPSCSITRSMK